MNTPKPSKCRRIFLRTQNYATVTSLVSSSLRNRLSKDWRKRLGRGAVNTVGGVLLGLGALGVTACPNPAGPSNGTEQEEENEYISSELNHDLNYDFGSETNPTDAIGTTLGSIYDVPDSDGLEAYFDDADFDTNFSGAIDDMYNKHGTMENGALRVFPHVGENTYLDLTVDVEVGYDSIEWYENGTKIGDGENFQYNVDFFDETRELDARVYLNGEEKDRHSINVEALSNVQPGYPALTPVSPEGAFSQPFGDDWRIDLDKGDPAEYNLVMKHFNGRDLESRNNVTSVDPFDPPEFVANSYNGEQCNDEDTSNFNGLKICVTPNTAANLWNVKLYTKDTEDDNYTLRHRSREYHNNSSESDRETVDIYLQEPDNQ